MESRAEAVDLSPLPAAYRAAFVEQQEVNDALRARVDSLAESNRRLEHLVSELRRFIYGKKSEKLDVDERQLALEDLEGGVTAVAEATPAPRAPSASAPKRPAAQRNLGHLPEHLPRIERTIEPDSTQCACGHGQMVRIGEDRSERLDIVPAQLRVLVTVRPKYACRACEEGVVQAPAPAHLVEGGLPTEGALAQVLIAKYADHCPLYRQSQIYARQGLDLHRSTLAGWVGKASFHLTPLVDRLRALLLRSGKLFMDETRAPVLDPGRGRTRSGYFWALARDDRGWSGPDPPGVVYHYAPGRGGRHAERILNGFSGILQVDGYAGYRRVAVPRGSATLTYCWAYVAARIMLRRAGGSPPGTAVLRFSAT